MLKNVFVNLKERGFIRSLLTELIIRVIIIISVTDTIELYGIDKNINALSIASTFVNTQSSDMENMNLEYEKGFFDFIIVGNILQQLRIHRMLLNI